MAHGHGSVIKISTLDILTELANGKCYKEISNEHNNVSIETMRSRVKRTKRRMKCMTLVQMIAVLTKKGVITIRPVG